jgi:hypothetical protein
MNSTTVVSSAQRTPKKQDAAAVRQGAPFAVERSRPPSPDHTALSGKVEVKVGG